MEIGKRLKLLRRERGITQSYLADKLYVSVQTINKWENGKCLPDAINLLHISDFYNISLDDLMRNESLRSSKQRKVKLRKNLLSFLHPFIFLFRKKT